MVKIDLKDRKILYELDLNCRQSNTHIGKKVGLKKDVVAYRIKRMMDQGIIKNFWTEINTFKFGYNVYRIYVNFQDVSTDVKNEIIQYFSDCKNAWAVMTVTGPIDLDVMVWVKDSLEFQQYWNTTLDKYGNYFSEHSVSVLTGGTAFKKTYFSEVKLPIWPIYLNLRNSKRYLGIEFWTRESHEKWTIFIYKKHSCPGNWTGLEQVLLKYDKCNKDRIL